MSRRKKYQLNEDKFLTEEEESRLLKSLVSANTRDRLLVTVALKTGARATELLNLTFNDLRPTTSEVFIRGLKGSNDRAIPIPKPLFKELYKYAKMVEDGGTIFGISYQRLVQIWDQYRLNGKNFHCLRHTFAIRLFTRHQNLRLVQVALGHSNIHNTMIYADYYYSTEELRRYLVTPEDDAEGEKVS